jgi:hypothetical protein
VRTTRQNELHSGWAAGAAAAAAASAGCAVFGGVCARAAPADARNAAVSPRSTDRGLTFCLILVPFCRVVLVGSLT